MSVNPHSIATQTADIAATEMNLIFGHQSTGEINDLSHSGHYGFAINSISHHG